MKIYLSGPMTGLADFNFPAFNAEATRLRALGHEVVNPAELNPDSDAPWHECMRRDLAALLEGWQKSSGAHLEMHVAHRVGMPILFANEVVA